MRKLATVRKVLDIKPIPNADMIELALIGGWQTVVKKGEFKVGDLGVYFEIDSFMPIEPKYEFLRKSSFRTMYTGEQGFRLRTIRLRGVLSQGLLLPLSSFSDLPPDTYDLTEHLKIKLWEAPIPASLDGEFIGPMPAGIQKTDAERVQNIPEYFEIHKDVEFEVSEKLDGSSMTVYFDHNKYGVCNRNWELKESDQNTYWMLAKRLFPAFENYCIGMGRNLALQGEAVGEGIQGNPLKIRGQKFFLFSIYDLDLHQYVKPDERYAIFFRLLQMGAQLDHVPVIEKRLKALSVHTMESILRYADGKSAVLVGAEREGLVFKPWSDNVGIFKVLSNEVLLKEQDSKLSEN